MTYHGPECPVRGRRGTINDSDCTCYQHLPECILPKGYGDCICEELRAYGERVLGTAREAIAAMVAIDEGAASRDYLLGAKDALASIDGLIWRNSNE